MYNNPGGKIKTFAKVVFVIGIIIAVLTGISVWVTGGGAINSASHYSSYSSRNSSDFGAGLLVFFIGLIVIAVGVFVSYISNLFLVAFGELVENSTIIKDKLLMMDQKNPGAYVAPKPTTKKCPFCGAENDSKSFTCSECGSGLVSNPDKKKDVRPISNIWVCSKCGNENVGGNFCFKCGAPK